MDSSAMPTITYAVSGETFFRFHALRGAWQDGVRFALFPDTGTIEIFLSATPLGEAGLTPAYTGATDVSKPDRGPWHHCQIDGTGTIVVVGFVSLIRVGSDGLRI